jgi:hypothetical protein
VFKNFWDISLEVSGQPLWGFDYFDLRTNGRKLKKAPYHFAGLFGSSDSRKKMFISYGVGFAESPLPKDPFYLYTLGARYRFSPKFSVDINGRSELDIPILVMPIEMQMENQLLGDEDCKILIC